MCNLSQGIVDETKAETKAEIIMNMYNKGYSLRQISEIVVLSEEAVKTIIEKNAPVMV